MFEYRVNVVINGILIDCVLGTGSEVTIQTENNANRLGIELLESIRSFRSKQK